MTEEEINKKAEKHCNEVLCNAHEKCNEVIKCRDWRSRRAGYFCGYEQALKDFEKENAELKARLNAINLLTPELEKMSKLRIQQLTIAKDLLLGFIELKNKPCAAGHSINMLLYENICADADQFLNSEVEK